MRHVVRREFLRVRPHLAHILRPPAPPSGASKAKQRPRSVPKSQVYRSENYIQRLKDKVPRSLPLSTCLAASPPCYCGCGGWRSASPWPTCCLNDTSDIECARHLRTTTLHGCCSLPLSASLFLLIVLLAAVARATTTRTSSLRRW